MSGLPPQIPEKSKPLRPFNVRKSFIGVLLGRLDLQILIFLTIAILYAIYFFTSSLATRQSGEDSAIFTLPSLAFLPFIFLILEGIWLAYVILVWQHLYYKITPAILINNGEVIDARPASVAFVSGILFKRQEDVPLTGIQNISYTQSILGRILGHGNIQIQTDRNQVLHLTNIPNPHNIERILREEDKKFVGDKLISPTAQQVAMVKATQQLGEQANAGGFVDTSDD